MFAQQRVFIDLTQTAQEPDRIIDDLTAQRDVNERLTPLRGEVIDLTAGDAPPTQSFGQYTNDFELTARASKELDELLTTRFNAPDTGKFLSERIRDALTPRGKRLPQNLISQLRGFATIRNRLTHEYNFNEIPNRARYVESVDAAFAELRALAQM